VATLRSMAAGRVYPEFTVPPLRNAGEVLEEIPYSGGHLYGRRGVNSLRVHS